MIFIVPLNNYYNNLIHWDEDEKVTLLGDHCQTIL